jgi:hypothetical protein
VQEFDSIMNHDNIKLLLFTGPAGSGKNSLIDVYCQSKGIDVTRYKDESESRFYDLEFDNGIGTDRSYPDDLVNLINFINSQTIIQNHSSTARVKFSSFARSKSGTSLNQDQKLIQ